MATEAKEAAVLDLSARLNDALKEPAPPPDVGVYEAVPFPEYHGWNAASNSRLSALHGKTPAHLKAYVDGLASKDSTAMLVGRAVHCAILEPDEFMSRYIVAGQCTANTKSGSRCTNTGSTYDASDGWRCGIHKKGALASDRGPCVLTHALFQDCLRVRDAVWAHAAARALLKGGRKELSLVWDDAETGVRCKARHDCHSVIEDFGAVVDVKKTTDASERGFMRAIWTYGYHRQGALYIEGAQANQLDIRDFVNIAVEAEPPYAVNVFRMNEASIDAGAQQLRGLLRTYAECCRTNEWPGYPERVRDIALPDYAWAQLDEELRNGNNSR